MKRACLFFCLLLFWESTSAKAANPRPKIAVALQGGGAKGLAHIGVLRWLEEHHIPIDFVAGTSMGGLVGGLYATGYSPAEIQDMVDGVDWNQVMSGAIPYPDLAFRRKEDLRAFPNALEIGLRHRVQPPGGLNSGQFVRFIIDRYVLPYSDVKTFDELPVPFRCVATDMVSGKEVVFKDGSLADALRATMSIPGAFSPVKLNGSVLADGGLLNNLPTDVAKQMGADIVIGVHLTTGPVAPQNVTSLLEMAGRSTDVMIDANELRGMERADILITVSLVGYSTLDFSRIQEIIPKGYSAAQERAGVLDRLSLDEQAWSSYIASRKSKIIKTTPTPAFVEVKGTSPNLSRDIEQQMSSFVNKPIDPQALQTKLTTQAGLGRFNSLSYSLINRGNQPGLLITAEEKDYSPPWIKPGFTIDGSDPDNVQFTLGGRLTIQDLGGYRSELRTDFSFGSTYLVSSEYYHPFSATSRWFVAPSLSASRSPLNLYVNNTFSAEYKLNNFDGTADLGYAFDRFSELRFGYEAGYLKASRWVGIRLLPDVSGRTGFSRGRYAMDRLDNPIIPRHGVALLTDGGWMDAYPAAKKGFPSGELNFLAFHQVSDPGSIYFVAAGGTTFGQHPGGLPVFSLGGPSRLAAYGLNQFLTDQYFYFRGGYLHRIGTLAPFLGSGVFLDGHYEVAKAYGLPNAPTLPNDGVVGVITQTILGPVLVGGSIGQGGHRKWFFQLGRVF
ncbi:MAG: patatin-like phospholipase family protein [Acidobacteriaceae bacterium]|nr:patatin-like phospholipase family protein [Acidobacteriaceae bacterium]